MRAHHDTQNSTAHVPPHFASGQNRTRTTNTQNGDPAKRRTNEFSHAERPVQTFLARIGVRRTSKISRCVALPERAQTFYHASTSYREHAGSVGRQRSCGARRSDCPKRWCAARSTKKLISLFPARTTLQLGEQLRERAVRQSAKLQVATTAEQRVIACASVDLACARRMHLSRDNSLLRWRTNSNFGVTPSTTATNATAKSDLSTTAQRMRTRVR